MKSSFKPINTGIVTLALVAALTPQAQAADGQARDATGPRMASQNHRPETEVIRLRPGQLPYVSLTADIFYRVVGSEIAAQRGIYGIAANTMTGLARDTGDPRLARRGLEFQLAHGNLPGALDAAHVWTRLSPKDPEASSTELALAAANGQTKGLSQALRQRIAASRDKPAAISQALVVLSRLNDRRLALRIFDDVLGDDLRKLPAAHLALADVAFAAGDYSRATEEARAALAADPKSEPAAQRALDYGAKIDPRRAQAEARAYIARNPNARKLRLILAGQMADAGDYASAQAELRVMSRRSPEDFDLLFMQAQLAYKAGQLQQAKTLLQQYLDVQNQRQRTIAPGATDAAAAASDARVLLARIAEDQGQYDAAIAELGRIDDSSLRFSVRLRQAVLCAKSGRVDAAIKRVDAAAPQDEEERTLGALTKAQILRDADRIGQAVAVLEAADQELPDTVAVKYELAILYERQDRLADLERMLRQVIALDPDYAHAYNALGYTLADRNQRLPEALDLITQALELSPGDPFILDSMGWIKFRMGDSAVAADFLRRAYAAHPQADVAAHLAEVLWTQGERDQAVELLRAALLKAPNNKAVLELGKRLGIRL